MTYRRHPRVARSGGREVVPAPAHRRAAPTRRASPSPVARCGSESGGLRSGTSRQRGDAATPAARGSRGARRPWGPLGGRPWVIWTEGADRVVDRRVRREAEGHPLPEIRLVSGNRDEVPHRREHDSAVFRRGCENLFETLPRGHQNSSPSQLNVQSAAYVVAAIRAMRVRHSLPRTSSPCSRMRCSTPARAYSSRISTVPSCER